MSTREATHEAPPSTSRVAGGLIGVVGSEAWHAGSTPGGDGAPVSAALLDLCRAYVDDPGGEAAIGAAGRHEGVPGVAWLLPIAFMERDAAARDRQARRVALSAGMGTFAISACVAYVELAARLFAAESTGEAVRAATGSPVPAPAPWPRLLGVGAADGLTAATWALSRPGQLAGVLWMLVESGEKRVAPWVAAAAAGLLGVREGGGAVPSQWHRALGSGQHGTCVEHADALVRARGTGGPHTFGRHVEVVG